jgi:hypothetical protein
MTDPKFVTSWAKPIGFALLILVNAVVLLALIAGFWLWKRHELQATQSRLEGSITQGFFEKVDDVGYLPKPNQRATARRVSGDRVVFDVTYGIGADQFREIPVRVDKDLHACVASFGDSNAFGDGVEDGETYAARIAVKGGGHYAVHNFGIPGWGPQNMLAGLQSGRFARALQCTPTNAIYPLFVDHIYRVEEGATIAGIGPFYRLDAAGKLERVPAFKPVGNPAGARQPWEIWRILEQVPRVNQESASLTAAIFREARRELLALAPSATFDVIYWENNREPAYINLLRELRDAGFRLHSIDRMLPNYSHDPLPYVLGRSDGHPNPFAHQLIGDYLATRIAESRK